MFQRVLTLFMFMALAFSSQSALAKKKAKSADDILGNWSIHDDVYHYERAIGRMYKDKKSGTYYMKVVYNNTKGIEPYTKCNKCPGRFKNKRIKGMVMMWNLKPSKRNPHKFTGGYGIDPYSGTMFRGTVRLGRRGNIMNVRATPLEVTFVGKRFAFQRSKKKIK